MTCLPAPRAKRAVRRHGAQLEVAGYAMERVGGDGRGDGKRRELERCGIGLLAGEA